MRNRNYHLATYNPWTDYKPGKQVENTHYQNIRQAIATINEMLTQNLSPKVRAEFEANKASLESLCRYL
jgi:hypothetical protein